MLLKNTLFVAHELQRAYAKDKGEIPNLVPVPLLPLDDLIKATLIDSIPSIDALVSDDISNEHHDALMELNGDAMADVTCGYVEMTVKKVLPQAKAFATQIKTTMDEIKKSTASMDFTIRMDALFEVLRNTDFMQEIETTAQRQITNAYHIKGFQPLSVTALGSVSPCDFDYLHYGVPSLDEELDAVYKEDLTNFRWQLDTFMSNLQHGDLKIVRQDNIVLSIISYIVFRNVYLYAKQGTYDRGETKFKLVDLVPKDTDRTELMSYMGDLMILYARAISRYTKSYISDLENDFITSNYKLVPSEEEAGGSMTIVVNKDAYTNYIKNGGTPTALFMYIKDNSSAIFVKGADLLPLVPEYDRRYNIDLVRQKRARDATEHDVRLMSYKKTMVSILAANVEEDTVIAGDIGLTYDEYKIKCIENIMASAVKPDTNRYGISRYVDDFISAKYWFCNADKIMASLNSIEFDSIGDKKNYAKSYLGIINDIVCSMFAKGVTNEQ